MGVDSKISSLFPVCAFCLMPTQRRSAAVPPAPFTQKGAASLSAWARLSPPIAALRDAATLSHQMWQSARPLLPPALQGGVQAGRWQDGVWSLTASSSAVAAKLSQFKPTLLRHLQDRGFALRDMRIRVQPRGEPGPQTAPTTTKPPSCPAAVQARLRQLLERAD